VEENWSCANKIPKMAISVANWPNFRPHNSKGAVKKYVRPKTLAAEFLSNVRQKGPKKGRKHFLVLSFEMLSKRKKDYVKIYNLSLCNVSYCSQNLFAVVSQLIIIHRYKTFIIGSRFFLPAAEFF
jgi:hypothetical protein